MDKGANMSVLPTAAYATKPYWIIVSDEGAGTKPRKHETWQSVYQESLRLAKLKPGINFNIFKYEGGTVATEPKVTFTAAEASSFWPAHIVPRWY
jgi:hypothetical protein